MRKKREYETMNNCTFNPNLSLSKEMNKYIRENSIKNRKLKKNEVIYLFT